VPVQLREIGSVDAVAVIAVKAQIGGELTKVFFREGEEMRKGQQLFEIDPRPYQQAIDQAQAADNDLRRAIVRGVIRSESLIDFHSAQALTQLLQINVDVV